MCFRWVVPWAEDKLKYSVCILDKIKQDQNLTFV